MSTTTASLYQPYQHPSALYPVVEDITELEYGCCPCDANNNILERFPLRNIAFPLPPPVDSSPSDNSERKGHHRRRSSSSSASLLFKRRSSRGSSFDDEVTVNTEQEDNVAKFEDTFVLTRMVRTQNHTLIRALQLTWYHSHLL